MALVKQKDGKWWLCIDYRRLKAVTLQDVCPLPWIDKNLDALAGSKCFSILDLINGYWQVPLDQGTQEKLPVTTQSGQCQHRQPIR